MSNFMFAAAMASNPWLLWWLISELLPGDRHLQLQFTGAFMLVLAPLLIIFAFYAGRITQREDTQKDQS